VAVIAAWAALPEAVRAGIVAMVKASTPESGAQQNQRNQRNRRGGGGGSS
jgi:hypothetical protein